MNEACRNGHLELVMLLIQHGAEINNWDLNGISPSMVACHCGHLTIAERLLELGAKLILQQVKGIIDQQLINQQANIYLIGSWATLQHKHTSDSDIAIEFHDENIAHQRLFSRIREAFEETNIPCRVDVVNLHKADTVIIEK